MFVRTFIWKKAGHMPSRTERSLWDMRTELSKARNTGRKGLPVRDALVDGGSSLPYDNFSRLYKDDVLVGCHTVLR